MVKIHRLNKENPAHRRGHVPIFAELKRYRNLCLEAIGGIVPCTDRSLQRVSCEEKRSILRRPEDEKLIVMIGHILVNTKHVY